MARALEGGEGGGGGGRWSTSNQRRLPISDPGRLNSVLKMKKSIRFWKKKAIKQLDWCLGAPYVGTGGPFIDTHRRLKLKEHTGTDLNSSTIRLNLTDS